MTSWTLNTDLSSKPIWRRRKPAEWAFKCFLGFCSSCSSFWSTGELLEIYDILGKFDLFWPLVPIGNAIFRENFAIFCIFTCQRHIISWAPFDLREKPLWRYTLGLLIPTYTHCLDQLWVTLTNYGVIGFQWSILAPTHTPAQSAMSRQLWIRLRAKAFGPNSVTSAPRKIPNSSSSAWSSPVLPVCNCNLNFY